MEIKYRIKDIGIFFIYMFNFRDMIYEIRESLRKIKQTYLTQNILKSDRIWYYMVMIFFIVIMILYHGNKKYFYAGIILLIWLIIALIPLYRGGEHRDWNRKRKNIPNKYDIQRLKEKAKNLNTLSSSDNYG